MEKLLTAPVLGGKIKAISSKSMAHRLLICAAFAQSGCEIVCEDTNDDILATVGCLEALGAKIERIGSSFFVTPISGVCRGEALDCGESGSTLRFMLPITAAIGAESTFYMRGRLPYRPLSPLYELLEQNGIYLTPQGTNPLITSGKLLGKDFSISANVSSQFISGLMFAIPLLQRFDGKNEEEDTPSSLALIGNIESSPYIDMTLDALREFGVAVEEAHPNADCGETKKYLFPPECAFTSPLRLEVEGDWSNAAFWLAAGAIGKEPIKVTSLNTRSHQGDMEMIKLLRNFGADVIVSGDEVTVFPARLHGTRINTAQIPDLVPILAVVAALSEGETTIFGASRLRLKESDRLLSVSAMLSALGANIKETSDGLVINGVPRLKGGRVDSAGDHRIAMAAAIASTACENGVLISGAEATQKSYPKFWEDFERLSK